MSECIDTFIQFQFRKDHWEKVLANKHYIPAELNHYHKILQEINDGIRREFQLYKRGVTSFSDTFVYGLTSELWADFTFEGDYYACLEFFNLPYIAFEDGGRHYQSERRFNPTVSDKAKTASVLGRMGDYYLSHWELQSLSKESPDEIQRVIQETLNPFKDYPDLNEI